MKVLKSIPTDLTVNDLTNKHIILARIGTNGQWSVLIKREFGSPGGYKWRCLEETFAGGNGFGDEYDSILEAVEWRWVGEVHAFTNVVTFGKFLAEQG